MKRQLRLRLEAEAGIAGAVNFYALQSPTAKQNFVEAVGEVFDKILASPRLYAVRYKNIRRINFSKFPYAIWFEIVERRDELTDEEMEFVVILRCYHQNRDVTARSFE